ASNGYRADEINLETGRADGKINTFDAGFNARGGFEIGSVMLTGFFSQGLTDFYHAPYQASLRHQVKGVSLGIWLNKTKPAPATIKDSDSDGIADLTDACPKI